MATTKLMPISEFVTQLRAALQRKDGYIMGATGQNPRNWKIDSWWFNQYTNSKQHTKALYWREHAERVWDCNGLAEGLYKDFSGTDINTKARYNYQNWCDPKKSGMIPPEYRVPGAAVFWGNTASDIHHVAYLDRPVDPDKPLGDWYLIEAMGVMYGVVSSRLNSRKPNFWGWMTKYFDYGNVSDVVSKNELHLGDRILKNGMEGTDVKELQTMLIELGYDCGSWGADGDFGDSTEIAVKNFQRDKKLEVDGQVGPFTIMALGEALVKADKVVTYPNIVEIVNGQCYIRSEPSIAGKIMGVAKKGSIFGYGGTTTEEGWNLIDYRNQNGWVSGKYSKLSK